MVMKRNLIRPVWQSRQLHSTGGRYGALTSKPYAFVARPWELTSVNAIDNMGSLGANIQLQTRGNELMRVLPRTNDEINDDWIDDKTRFSYDGLKVQRLIKPLCRSEEDPSKWDRQTFEWRDVLQRVNGAFKTLSQSNDNIVNFRSIVGPRTDMETVLALSDFTELVSKDEKNCAVEVVGSQPRISKGIPSTYRFNSTILGVEEADLCLLIGTNLMSDCPLLASRLLKAFRTDEIRIAQLGFDNGLAFPSEQLGLSPSILEEIVEEKHPFFKVLKAAERPMVVVDSSVYDREDSKKIEVLLEQLAKKTNLLKTSESGEIFWNGLNILHKNANDVGILDFGRVKPLQDSTTETDVLYLVDVQAEDLPNGQADVERLIQSSKFIIYQGTHGDELAGIADVILPGAAFSEKSGIFTNVEGRAQLSNRALTPPGVGKTDWMIVRAISEVLGKSLPYTTSDELKERLETLVPNTKYSNLGEIQAIDFVVDDMSALLKTENKILKTPFVPNRSDFFLEGHPTARVSKVMAACSLDHMADELNFVDL